MPSSISRMLNGVKTTANPPNSDAISSTCASPPNVFDDSGSYALG
jgi:hypothetical protein